MFVGSPLRLVATALLVPLLFGNEASVAARAAKTETRPVRSAETHTLALQDEELAPLVGAKIGWRPREGAKVAWAEGLEPIVIECANTATETRVRLYRDDGRIDPWGLELFVETVSELARTHAINTRTVQLAMKAAYHFKAKKMTVVSGYRPGHGPHGAGDALDFRLPGVSARALASYLRKMPRAGVGIYTNPGTQYVHLDSREQSFHWLDASPPGKTWREKALGDPMREERDQAWTPQNDLPIDP